MEINLSEYIRNHELMMGHLFLTGLTNTIKDKEFSKFVNKNGIDGVGTVADASFFIDGHEVDLFKLIEGWEKQVDEMISKEAKKLIEDRFGGISNILYDLESRVKVEIDKRLEDWEKDNE